MDAALSIAAAAQAPAPDRNAAAAARKAEEFEALVLAQLLKPMFDAADAPSLFGGDGPEKDAFSAMALDAYAGAIAARGGVGIADQVRAALIRMQSDSQISRGNIR